MPTKIITIGTDRNIFKEGSAARSRMVEYGTLFDELHIIVFSLRKNGLQAFRLSENVWVYPTNSICKLMYCWDAFSIGKKISKSYGPIHTVSSQDPFECGWVSLFLSRAIKCQFQVQIHTDLFSSYFKRSSPLNFVRAICAPLILKRADRVRAVSPRIKNSIVHYVSEEKVSVLPIYVGKREGVSQIGRQRLFPQFDFVCLTVSRLSQEKNIGPLIEIFARFKKDHPRAGFVIVGDGGQREWLQQLATKLLIGDSVVFAGWQESTEAYYESADVFLLNSSYEGYGMAVVEAVLHGVPVIMTNVGIAGDILYNDLEALICEVGDERCFEEALTKINSSEQLRAELAQRAIKKMESATVSKEKYLEQYRKGIIG